MRNILCSTGAFIGRANGNDCVSRLEALREK